MTEYWRWPETKWASKDIDWKKAKTITAGVIGTTSTQAVVMCGGELFSYVNLRNGADFQNIAKQAMEQALGNTGIKPQYTVATVLAAGTLPLPRRQLMKKPATPKVLIICLGLR